MVNQERARATREVLLQSAREVFAESGYAAASIADVVRRADASVGSLYHHFGGKADVYLALYEDYQARQEERAAAAVRAARSTDEQDPTSLFLTGARAFLHGCWEDRHLAVLFQLGEGPPGFDLVRRQRFNTWISANAKLLGGRREPFGQALALVLTTVISEAGREVALQPSPQRATRYVDAVLELLARILTDR